MMTLADLVQPRTGLTTQIFRSMPPPDEPQIQTHSATIPVAGLWPHLGSKAIPVRGTGSGLDGSQCQIRCLAEALERYSAACYTEEQFVKASERDLGSDAVPVSSIPVCSESELSHNRCPLRRPSAEDKMRWVKALSLDDRRVVYLPAVLVYTRFRFEMPGERIWLPNTSGCAAHTSFALALLGSLLELIERDAMTVAWWQQLPLPKIEIDLPSSALTRYLQICNQSAEELSYSFFDATSDIGIPTVICVRTCSVDPLATTLVTCSADIDPEVAIIKCIREMAAARTAFYHPASPPVSVDDIVDIKHGAIYMAPRSQASAFDFLLQSGSSRRLSEMPSLVNCSEVDNLKTVLARLRTANMPVYAADLTTDEAQRCGIFVVRTIVPALQPISFHYRARYLGHPRLYDAPTRMGYSSRAENELNPWPQPMA